jgi:hypothetical protein
MMMDANLTEARNLIAMDVFMKREINIRVLLGASPPVQLKDTRFDALVNAEEYRRMFLEANHTDTWFQRLNKAFGGSA